MAESEQTLMAELSALSDKFDTWTIEEPKASKRPPIGRPSGIAKLGMPGSAQVTGYGKRLMAGRQASQGPPKEIEQYEEEVNGAYEKTKCQEVKAKMDQVELEIIRNGGLNCGWDAADHKDFLRLRTKFNNKTVTVAFVNAMSRAVPMADEVAVKEHCVAYDTYLDLT